LSYPQEIVGGYFFYWRTLYIICCNLYSIMFTRLRCLATRRERITVHPMSGLCVFTQSTHWSCSGYVNWGCRIFSFFVLL